MDNSISHPFRRRGNYPPSYAGVQASDAQRVAEPNALDVERVIEVALEERVALEVNGLPDRLDLRDEHVRLCVEAGLPVICSTDAHSVRGLSNMRLSVATARRGWATAADVLNTRPLSELLRS